MKKNSPTTILVTGASSGIGRALATTYAEPGVRLYLTGRNKAALSETAATCRQAQADVETTLLDVKNQDAVKDWVDSIAATTPIDLAIANAGVLGSHGPDRQFEDADTALNQINTNLNGCISLVTGVVPHMQKRRQGHIALISSLSALQPVSDMPAYAASKAGVNAYGEAIGAYLQKDGIDVSVICPGFIKTPMVEQFEAWRPFEMPVETAAASIKNALDKKRAFHAFPAPLYLAIKLGRLLPWRVRRLTTKAFDYRR